MQFCATGFSPPFRRLFSSEVHDSDMAGLYYRGFTVVISAPEEYADPKIPKGHRKIDRKAYSTQLLQSFVPNVISSSLARIFLFRIHNQKSSLPAKDGNPPVCPSACAQRVDAAARHCREITGHTWHQECVYRVLVLEGPAVWKTPLI